MRKIVWIITGFLIICLTGCGKQDQTYAESCWASISSSTYLDGYVAKNAKNLDMEALQSEAGNSENTLSQQFKATALLCAAEYGKQEKEYPISSSYVDAFFEKAVTEEEAFWKALEESTRFEIFIPPMLDAAKNMNGEILVKLVEGIPEDSEYAYHMQTSLDDWIKENLRTVLTMDDALADSGYFDKWISNEWNIEIFYNDVQQNSLNDALEYIMYLRDKVLPTAQGGNDPALFVGQSKFTGEDFLHTSMMIIIDQELTLQEPEGEEILEEIDIEGKKVAALYRNLHADEFPYSPSPLRMKCDFMINLSDEECPTSIEEADYYLVLTPTYEYGDYYYYENGKASDIREVYSTTSIDLYEAQTGRFLIHLGNVLEEPSEKTMTRGSDNKPRYPNEINGDKLYYIYSHVNDPDAYADLVDHIGGQTEFKKDETILIGQWEITYHGYEISDMLENKIFEYTAGAGNQLIKAEFTLTNRGNDGDYFFSSIPSEQDNVEIYVIDYKNNTYYESINLDISSFGLFGEGVMEPNDTQTGEIIFEVTDESIKEKDSLFIAVTKGRQMLICPLGE